MAQSPPEVFKQVNWLWDKNKAAGMEGDEVALLVYRSNLLGADLRLTNFGGGNTSCKVLAPDPLTGKGVMVLWVKGSGGDLGTMTRSGLAALYLDRMEGLKNIYPGKDHEDGMVALLDRCIFDPASKAPSIDTPLHGFLPFKHIDHLHPDAAIAIAAAKDGRKITEEIFEGKLGWVDWQRPGFDLGLKLRECLDKQPGIRGIMLGSHGLFTWGETSFDCYRNTLEVVERCANFLAKAEGRSGPVFGGARCPDLPVGERRKKAAALAPLLRGLCSSLSRKVGYFTDDERVMEFVNSRDLGRLGTMGTSCPDHFLRTKIFPLILDKDLGNSGDLLQQLQPFFETYRSAYREYYLGFSEPGSPAMRDPNPVVILYPGVGMFTFAGNHQTARVAAEFYINAIQVMRGAEAVSSYTALPRREAFRIEYWALEEAKLKRLPPPRPLAGRVALVTGSAGGIGKAIARKFAQEGACVVLCDLDGPRLESAHQEFLEEFGKDTAIAGRLDVTDPGSIRDLLDAAALAFGGVDILVNCAGISISKHLEDHTEQDWDRLYDILVKGQFLVTQAALIPMRQQGFGGDILNIVSKNALVSGPDNAAYGSAKAAQLHLSRLNAAELGKDRIRVNVVNPDAVIAGSQIWAGAWAEGRAKAYGVAVEDLPTFYAKRTLLNEIILPEDIANACFAFVSGLLNKSTGNMINVDGGVAMAFPR